MAHSMSHRNFYPSHKFFLLSLFTTGIAGIALIWLCTRWGAGLMDDSFVYITSARNLIAGKGLAWPQGDGSLAPMTHYPPLFPLTLAALSVIGLEATAAARLVNTLAFGANIIIIAWLTYRFTANRALALLAALLCLFSDVLIEVHVWALSEPLFILFSLTYLLSFIRYFQTQRAAWLITGAIAAGLALLTRYIGVSLIAAGAAMLVFLPVAPKRRWKDLLLFIAISLLPIALWALRNWFLIGGATDRAAQQHFITLKQLQRGLNTFLLWFLPGRLINDHEVIVTLVLILAGAAIAATLRRLKADAPEAPIDPTFYWVLGLQILCYLCVLVASKSFFDPVTPLNNRILSPLLPTLLILLLAFLGAVWQRAKLRPLVVAALLAFFAFYAYRAIDLIPRLYQTGIGFSRKGWHNSQTLQAVRSLPQTAIFSNSPAAIYMWTDRPAYSIADQSLMRRQMQQNGAVLVIFNSVSLNLYDITFEELTQGLTEVDKFKDGSIYLMAP